MASEPIYEHYKGGKYQVKGYGTLESDGTRMVIYQSVDNPKIWIRPETEFDEKFKLMTKEKDVVPDEWRKQLKSGHKSKRKTISLRDYQDAYFAYRSYQDSPGSDIEIKMKKWKKIMQTFEQENNLE